MSQTILIVEDEVRLLNHLEERIMSEGFIINRCETYSELENYITENSNKQPDIVILDRLLSGKDSAQLLPKLTNGLPNAKVIVLSALNSANDKITMLDQGVDDYLAKPFEVDELIARVKALLRRNSREIIFANIVLDLEKRIARVDGQEVLLQNKEFYLLKTLMKVPGKIFDKKFLYEHVWEMNSEVESNVVETTVNKLRRRLEESGAKVKINCIRYKGYWIEE